MNEKPQSRKTDSDELRTRLLGADASAVNDNLLERAEVFVGDHIWQDTAFTGLQIRVLEYLGAGSSRLTALMRIDPKADSVTMAATGIELLVQHGLVSDDESEYMHPFYLRNPRERSGANQTITLHAGSQNSRVQDGSLEFYIALGQLAHSDQQRRCINLADGNLWLPGPVEHTEVMPLHMHNGSNAMLVRWLRSTTFQPRLDPLGEEVLVISGTLRDAFGKYKSGDWVRNPVAAWQSWSGEAGTLVYYKNGHFG